MATCSRRFIPVVSAMAILAGLVLRATPAGATFPGPDGRIAFGSDRYGGGDHNIFTMKPNGSDVTQLTFLTADQGAALDQSWSPYGSMLVFERRNATGSRRQIWVMNADGSDQHRLFPDPWYLDFEPSYSPDGLRVIFSRCRPDFSSCAIYQIASGGAGHPIALTAFGTGRLDRYPRYSPDGTEIALASFGRGGVGAAIYVMDADGSHVHRITPGKLTGFKPDWSPDGSRIVFFSHCCVPGTSQIWAVNPDGSGLTQLTHPAPRNDAAPSWSPQGDQIAFDRFSSRSSIWTMNPNGAGLIKIQADAFQPAWGPAP